MTHTEKVLRLLRDGKPHSHMEGYRLGVMLHSRVSDLRRDGYVIRCWREKDLYLYQLEPEPVWAGSPDGGEATADAESGSFSSPVLDGGVAANGGAGAATPSPGATPTLFPL